MLRLLATTIAACCCAAYCLCCALRMNVAHQMLTHPPLSAFGHHMMPALTEGLCLRLRVYHSRRYTLLLLLRLHRFCVAAALLMMSKICC